MDARSIDEKDLCGGKGLDPQNSVPGSLGLGRNNGNLLTHEAIEKGGFTHIASPHDRDNTRAEITVLFLQPPPRASSFS